MAKAKTRQGMRSPIVFIAAVPFAEIKLLSLVSEDILQHSMNQHGSRISALEPPVVSHPQAKLGALKHIVVRKCNRFAVDRQQMDRDAAHAARHFVNVAQELTNPLVCQRRPGGGTSLPALPGNLLADVV